MRSRDCARLLAVARQMLARDGARLAAQTAALVEIAAARQALRTEAAAGAAQCSQSCDPLDLLAYGRFDGWAARRTRALDGAAQKVRAERAVARAELARSFGRTRALETLERAAQQSEKLERAARAERNGQPPDD